MKYACVILSQVLLLGVMVAVITFLADWHAMQKGRGRSIVGTIGSVSGLGAADDNGRDDACRRYVMQFLNGTTDYKDECQGMYNAWKAADCQDESFLTANHVDGPTEPPVELDDIFENWECCEGISDFYEKNCQKEGLDPTKLFGVVAVLVVCGLVKSSIRLANVRWIPDAGAYIVVGALVGGLIRFIDPDVVSEKLAFDNDLFLHIMLPPIVFEAAIRIDKKSFRRDLYPILMFAIFGTAFSAIAIGFGTHFLSSKIGGTKLPLLDSLLFGALTSSIDPVATLSILDGVGVNQGDTLYTMIFGESLLNDGVSIVLFDSLVRHMGDAAVVDVFTVHDTLFHFFLVSLCSIFIGVVCAVLCTFYFWALQGLNTAVSEVALFFAWALIPYYIADGLHFSGIISIMVMGFMLDFFVIGGFESDEGEWMAFMSMENEEESPHPVEPCFGRIKCACAQAFSGKGHISSRSQHHVHFVAEVISSVMETAIFAYLGLFLFNGQVWVFGLTAIGIFSCISSRGVQVILLSVLINVCVWMDVESRLGRLWSCLRGRRMSTADDDDSIASEGKAYLDAKTQFILFSAGIRGAVSYALVQNIPVYDAVTKHGSHFKGELKAMTSAAIVFILFTFGSLTYFTVKHTPGESYDRAAGPLTHRLLSTTLASDDELDESDLNSSTLEIEGRRPRPRMNH